MLQAPQIGFQWEAKVSPHPAPAPQVRGDDVLPDFSGREVGFPVLSPRTALFSFLLHTSPGLLERRVLKVGPSQESRAVPHNREGSDDHGDVPTDALFG